MILPDFVLPSRANQHWLTSGIDSMESCMDPDHFQSFPHAVEYHYNSRGYRDLEWSQDLAQAIWCMGDSFTVGLGSAQQHTWPCLLGLATGRRTINVSMDGASNDWIARKTLRVLEEIQPDHMVIHWSYAHRRELGIEAALDRKWHDFYQAIKDPDWPSCDRKNIQDLPQHILEEIQVTHGGWNDKEIFDDERLVHYMPCDIQDDLDNTLHNINLVEANKNSTRIIHSFVSGFVPRSHTHKIQDLITACCVPETTMLDLARDGHHYGVKTQQSLVDQLRPLL